MTAADNEPDTPTGAPEPAPVEAAAGQSDAAPHQKFGEMLGEAALEAEFETGRHEETVAQAKRHILVRVARIVAGVIVVMFGIALLALPGPGFLTIAGGLALLSADVPFARRLLKQVRSRLPEDADGNIPWWVWGSMVAGFLAFTAVSIWWTFLR